MDLTDEQRSAYAAKLTQARRQWNDGDESPVLTAVAAVSGVDADHLGWHVEAIRGWESHDLGYEEAVWESARHLVAAADSADGRPRTCLDCGQPAIGPFCDPCAPPAS